VSNNGQATDDLFDPDDTDTRPGDAGQGSAIEQLQEVDSGSAGGIEAAEDPLSQFTETVLDVDDTLGTYELWIDVLLQKPGSLSEMAAKKLLSSEKSPLKPIGDAIDQMSDLDGDGKLNALEQLYKYLISNGVEKELAQTIKDVFGSKEDEEEKNEEPAPEEEETDDGGQHFDQTEQEAEQRRVDLQRESDQRRAEREAEYDQRREELQAESDQRVEALQNQEQASAEPSQFQQRLQELEAQRDAAMTEEMEKYKADIQKCDPDQVNERFSQFEARIDEIDKEYKQKIEDLDYSEEKGSGDTKGQEHQQQAEMLQQRSDSEGMPTTAASTGDEPEKGSSSGMSTTAAGYSDGFSSSDSSGKSQDQGPSL